MYPPKVHQFAYVTDEACTEDEILSMEIIIMKVKRQSSLIKDEPACPLFWLAFDDWNQILFSSSSFAWFFFFEHFFFKR